MTSPPISHALTNDAGERGVKAFRIAKTKRRTVIVAEVKFRQVALQVRAADVVIRADDAALEDREVTLNGVRVCAATDVFASAVID